MLNFKATVFLIDALVIVLGTLNNLLNLLMKQTVLIVIVFYLSVQPLFSQENLGIPPSPTVASFVTVEKDSVNSSGKIVHNIPLWDMTLGKYSFPISLNYSSSGVRIEETPSYVGTGWNFSAGGVITRSVMDHPDDINNTDHGSGILHTNILNEIFRTTKSIRTAKIKNNSGCKIQASKSKMLFIFLSINVHAALNVGRYKFDDNFV